MSSVVVGRQVAAVAKADVWKSSVFYQTTASTQIQGNSSKVDLQMIGRPMEMPVMRALRTDFIYDNNISYSSGSEHEGESLCLDAMVSEFLEDGSDKRSSRNGHNSEDEREMSELMKSLKTLTQSFSTIERELMETVLSITEALKGVPEAICDTNSGSCTGACLRRSLMVELRSRGYDAAVCKSRWEQSKNSPGGDYEFLDVFMVAGQSGRERVIVDVDFREQFRIARPSAQYSSLLSMIPQVFVGKIDRVIHISDVMSEAAKESARKNDMYLPPWRKPEYMRLKWSAQYKRTVNELPSTDKPSEACAVHVLTKGSVPTMIRTPEVEKPAVIDNTNWKLPEVREKRKPVKVTAGLALVLESEKPLSRQSRLLMAAGS